MAKSFIPHRAPGRQPTAQESAAANEAAFGPSQPRAPRAKKPSAPKQTALTTKVSPSVSRVQKQMQQSGVHQ